MQEAREYATVQGTTLERMLFECLKAELEKRRDASKVYAYLMSQHDWLPDDYVFDRDEANSK